MGGKLEGCRTGWSRDQVKEAADYLVRMFLTHRACQLATVTGSFRRNRTVINDLDFVMLVLPQHEKPLGELLTSIGVKNWKEGRTNASFAYKVMPSNARMQVDLFIVSSPETYGAEIMTWTGSARHNVAMRMLAKMKGLKLSQRGLFDGDRLVAGRTERDVFEKLGLPFIPPERRDDYEDVKRLVSLRTTDHDEA